MPWGSHHAHKVLMDEASDIYVPGKALLQVSVQRGSRIPMGISKHTDACLQGHPKLHPRGFIFQLSVDVCRVDVCFCLNIEDVNSLAVVTTILEQVPTCIYSIKSDTSHQLLLINVWMAVCT